MSHIANARNTDPTSSHFAGEYIETSGDAARQRRIALEAVKANPGLTSLELAGKCELDRYQLGRRLPEVIGVEKGPMRLCSISKVKKPCVTWVVRKHEVA